MTVEMPAVSLLNSFAHMDIDMALTCKGNMDQDCPVWDHNIALGVVCAETAAEATVTSRAIRRCLWFPRRILTDCL